MDSTVYDGWLALHPCVYGKSEAGYARPGFPQYTITHVPTSGGIVEFRQVRFAKKCAEELASTVAPFEDNPGEEVLRLVVGICQRWLAIEAEELHK